MGCTLVCIEILWQGSTNRLAIAVVEATTIDTVTEVVIIVVIVVMIVACSKDRTLSVGD